MSFVPAKNNFTCNSIKRDGVALVGLPPDALDPNDIPHRRTARPQLAGGLFRYINSLETCNPYSIQQVEDFWCTSNFFVKPELRLNPTPMNINFF